MDYATVVAAFFDPATAEHPTPAVLGDADPARRLRDAFEPISMHAVWSPLVHERLAARGLDFFGTYVGGRAAVMGEPNGAVVAAAFAAFDPAMIGAVWDGARAQVNVEDLRDLTVTSTGESLAKVIGDEAAVGEVADRLSVVVEDLDPTGRPLFSGVQALPRPDDPHTRLWQSCLALREHRGDAHVAAYVTEGFGPVRMNILTELWLGYPLGEYSGTRAWSEDATAKALESLRSDGYLDAANELTASGRAIRDSIEARTDAMEAVVVQALGADLDSVATQLDTWSQACVHAQTFPPDPRKRAAG